jgi:hypothetical protein
MLSGASAGRNAETLAPFGKNFDGVMTVINTDELWSGFRILNTEELWSGFRIHLLVTFHREVSLNKLRDAFTRPVSAMLIERAKALKVIFLTFSTQNKQAKVAIVA